MTNLPKRAVIALIVWTYGCSGATQIDLNARVNVSPAFSATEQETILAAIQNWRDATGGTVAIHTEISDDRAGAEMYVSVGNTPGLAGRTDVAAGSMTLDPEMVAEAVAVEGGTYEQTLLDTTMHEFGHAFGLHHVVGTLMRPVGFGGARVDATTLRLFRANY